MSDNSVLVSAKIYLRKISILHKSMSSIQYYSQESGIIESLSALYGIKL